MDKRERTDLTIAGKIRDEINEILARYDIPSDVYDRDARIDAACVMLAQAAIAALEPMDKPRVKPLAWSDPAPPDETCRYDYITAETPFGSVRLEWKGWKDYDAPCGHTPWGEFVIGDTLDEAKAAAQADYEARILAALEPVTVQEAARVLLDAMSDITAKPLAEMSDAMKIEAHPAILLRGLCAALRALAQKDAE